MSFILHNKAFLQINLIISAFRPSWKLVSKWNENHLVKYFTTYLHKNQLNESYFIFRDFSIISLFFKFK